MTDVDVCVQTTFLFKFSNIIIWKFHSALLYSQYRFVRVLVVCVVFAHGSCMQLVLLVPYFVSTASGSADPIR